MSEKQYFSFWQIWILQILCFKPIYNLPITFPRSSPSKEMMESLKFSFPNVFLASLAIHMISDFIRVMWWRTTYIYMHGIFLHFFHSYKFGSQLSQIKSFKYTLTLILILTLTLNLNHDHNPYNFIVNCYFSSKILYAQHSWIFMSVWLYSFDLCMRVWLYPKPWVSDTTTCVWLDGKDMRVVVYTA